MRVECKRDRKALGRTLARAAVIMGMVGACGGMAHAADQDPANFACDGDVSSSASRILAIHREEVGDGSRLLGSTDDLKALLAAMRRGDQDIRFLAMGLMGRCGQRADSDAMRLVIPTIRTIDQVNKDVLRRILQEKGWPVISIYGEEADQTAFLMAQHADRDPKFQRVVLKILEDQLRAGETRGENYALLFDRVRIAEAQPQRYGSQGRCVGKAWVPDRLEDPKKVDQLRKSVGLEPMAEYRKKVTSLFCAGAL